MNMFRLLGGVPSPFIRVEEADELNSEEEEVDEDMPDPDHPTLQPHDPGPDDPGSGQEEGESDDEVIRQPIPFQMGVTPIAEEGGTNDELQTWYEGTDELEPRGSTDTVPKSVPKPRPKPTARERSPRNLRNRQVCTLNIEPTEGKGPLEPTSTW